MRYNPNGPDWYPFIVTGLITVAKGLLPGVSEMGSRGHSLDLQSYCHFPGMVGALGALGGKHVAELRQR